MWIFEGFSGNLYWVVDGTELISRVLSNNTQVDAGGWRSLRGWPKRIPARIGIPRRETERERIWESTAMEVNAGEVKWGITHTYHFKCVGRGGRNKRRSRSPPSSYSSSSTSSSSSSSSSSCWRGVVHDVEKLLNKQSLASSDER